jgi:hypothetical protein
MGLLASTDGTPGLVTDVGQISLTEPTLPAVRPVGLAAAIESTPPAPCAVPRLRLGVAVLIHNFGVPPRRPVPTLPSGLCSPPTPTARQLGARKVRAHALPPSPPRIRPGAAHISPRRRFPPSFSPVCISVGGR